MGVGDTDADGVTDAVSETDGDFVGDRLGVAVGVAVADAVTDGVNVGVALVDGVSDDAPLRVTDGVTLDVTVIAAVMDAVLDGLAVADTDAVNDGVGNVGGGANRMTLLDVSATYTIPDTAAALTPRGLLANRAVVVEPSAKAEQPCVPAMVVTCAPGMPMSRTAQVLMSTT